MKSVPRNASFLPQNSPKCIWWGAYSAPPDTVAGLRGGGRYSFFIDTFGS